MSELSKRSLEFGRNVSLERLDNEKWNSVLEHEFFKNVRKKELFLLSVAIGYKAGIKLELKESYPTINFSGISEEQKYILGAFGLAELGEDSLKKDGENNIKNEAAMYAKGGFDIIKKIIEDNPNPMDAADEIIMKIKELKGE